MTLSQIGILLFVTSVWLLAGGWWWQLTQWIQHSGEVADLTRLAPADSHTPDENSCQLSVIVPACNEEDSIAETLRSLLASEGVRLQIIAVNDRSTDRTGEIMDKVAAQTLNQNLKHDIQVIHIKELSKGWIGKPYALAVAARLARADWLIFTDGDVRFAPKAISLALQYARQQRADHLVLMPDWRMESHGEAAMHGAMHALSAWTLHLWRIADPQSREFLGVGAFNMIRRDVYEALGGFEALRMEVLEDLRLGWLVKRAGYRQRVVLGPGLASVRWSVGAWGVVRNLEKNFFALYRYNTAIALLACLGLVVQIAWPILALAVAGWAGVGGLAIYGAIAGLYLVSRKVTRVPARYMILYPVAVCVFTYALLRSVALALFRGGVAWRGTLYSLKDLRAHAGRSWLSQ